MVLKGNVAPQAGSHNAKAGETQTLETGEQ